MKIRRGLICPVRGDGAEGRVKENIWRAIGWKVKNESPEVEAIVPFLELRKLLDEKIPEHREAGMLAGRIIYGTCHEVVVKLHGQKLMGGMLGDIEFCKARGIPVIFEEEEKNVKEG